MLTVGLSQTYNKPKASFSANYKEVASIISSPRKFNTRKNGLSDLINADLRKNNYAGAMETISNARKFLKEIEKGKIGMEFKRSLLLARRVGQEIGEFTHGIGKDILKKYNSGARLTDNERALLKKMGCFTRK